MISVGVPTTALLSSRRNGELRLHHSDRAAVRFGDGAQVHVLHGTVVPEWVVLNPTVQQIHAEPNVEVRRCAIERLGWDAYVEQAGLDLVATALDPGNSGSDLCLYDMPRRGWDAPPRVLLVVNGSLEPDGLRRYGSGTTDGDPPHAPRADLPHARPSPRPARLLDDVDRPPRRNRIPRRRRAG